jgi:hypothetical protein
MAGVQWYRNRKEARYQGAFAFLDDKPFKRSNIIVPYSGVIWSYGSHFAMAIKKPGYILVNEDKYSATTSRHQGALKTVLSVAGYVQQTDLAPYEYDGHTFSRWERSS